MQGDLVRRHGEEVDAGVPRASDTNDRGIAVRGSDKTSVHCLIGTTHGTGCALVTDEFPLLLNLRDVYWTREGPWAVDLALAITATAAAYFTGIPVWRGLGEKVRS